jgi:hypothetical protein
MTKQSMSFLIISLIATNLCAQGPAGGFIHRSPLEADEGGQALQTDGLLAEASGQVFLQANRYYENSSYKQAVSCYESLVDKGLSDAKLFYNLGNAYFRINRLGKAILYYERALKISPRDEDIKYNLKFVRTFIKEPDSSIFHKIINFFTLNELTVFSSLIYFLFMTGVILSLFLKHTVGRWANITLGVILFLGLAWWYAGFSVVEKRVSAIVITSPAEVRNGPGEDYSVGFTLPEGKKVVVLSEKDDWCAVAVKQYEPQEVLLKGWIPRGIIEKI